MDLQNSVYATGKRKNAVARTWLAPGSGQIIVNEKPLEAYFPVESARILLLEPFRITNTQGDYDVRISVRGGGITGQAGAIRHGITRALMEVNPEFRLPLKKAGFVKRDPREKERKKYGQRGARARFQFSKR
ncbi:MAG TPA: 30S ribosomal protein S9 [Desulfobacteraceae bacterium]|nr:30S ribosomal protein S9 [Deltaproteobacteria bacterium]RLB97954.1 MAG: 30S ribosomal protein S9 [Deltaproteobacteria bacterium]HDI59336.1 30S ribosomal protein S9 [Desulfobacteraceae bacterium]